MVSPPLFEGNVLFSGEICERSSASCHKDSGETYRTGTSISAENIRSFDIASELPFALTIAYSTHPRFSQNFFRTPANAGMMFSIGTTVTLRFRLRRNWNQVVAISLSQSAALLFILPEIAVTAVSGLVLRIDLFVHYKTSNPWSCPKIRAQKKSAHPALFQGE